MLKLRYIFIEYLIDTIGECHVLNLYTVIHDLDGWFRRGMCNNILKRLRFRHMRVVKHHLPVWLVKPFLKPLEGSAV